MKTCGDVDGDVAPKRHESSKDLIACQPELLASFAQIQQSYKSKVRAGHYLKRALLSSGAVKPSYEGQGDRINDGDDGDEIIVSAQSEQDLRSSFESVTLEPQPWFNTWPNRERTAVTEEQKPTLSVPLKDFDLPIVYDPLTKGLHLAKSSSESEHSKAPEGSYSSNVSSLSDTCRKGDEDDLGCHSLSVRLQADSVHTEQLESVGAGPEVTSNDNVDSKSGVLYGLISKWKVKSDDYWSLFSRSDSASSSPSRKRSDAETPTTNDRVQGSTALIQMDRPHGLPVKDTIEAKAHSEEHDKIVYTARKREQKEAKLRKKKLQNQLKAENELVRLTRIWNQEILPKWSQTKKQKQTMELWWHGIPPCIRGRLWRLAIPNDLNITKELFEICLNRARERLLRSSAAGSTDSLDDFNDDLVDRAESLELIQLDISRTFPHLCIFQKNGPYYEALHGLLAAYVCYRPDIGYVQGMSFIAAVLILNMEAHEAFICFANLLNRPCHQAFYSMNQQVVGGVKFWAYHAGHVLGAAMFMLEISGVKILYTGDFSRQEDRHLMAAEIPSVRPDVLITEATYGTHVHENREEREGRFTALVHDIVTRGGRCLIPVFALGRAQELLLILDEYWSQHPELHDIPIYYASSLAKKCMAVYQTYVNAMNDKIKRQIAVNNPFVFTHISNLKGIDQFEDIGPCVVMASPGMMQSGLSRELFESWCTDSKNGVIIAGYCVEGTPAKTILSEPEEIVTMSGQKLKLNMTVAYISFSAHTDYQQTSEFIRQLEPPHIVLVHGEQNEMSRLKSALQREYDGDPERSINIYNPRNTESVELYFRGEKIAKVMGSLAVESPKPGNKISGILVKRDFNYHILAPTDLGKYTSLTTSQVAQKQLIPFGGSLAILRTMLAHVASPLETIDMKRVRAFNCIDVILNKKNVILEWLSTPVNDMFADCIFSTILEAESIDNSASLSNVRMKMDRMHFKECVIEMLQEMFGEECVPKIFKGDRLQVTVNGRKANIDLLTLDVTCKEDAALQQVVLTAITKLYQSLTPTSAPLVKGH